MTSIATTKYRGSTEKNCQFGLFRTAQSPIPGGKTGYVPHRQTCTYWVQSLMVRISLSEWMEQNRCRHAAGAGPNILNI